MTTPASPASDASPSSPSPVVAGTPTVGSASMWVAAGTAASRLTGFLRVFALGFAVGQSPLGDLYTQANAAPNLIFELVVGGVLSATLVPVFVAAREQEDDEATSVLLSTGFVAAASLSLLALVIALGVDVLLIDGPVDGAEWTESQTRARIFMDLVYLVLPQILFYGMASLSTAYLNAARRFRTAAFAPVLTNLVSIAAFIVLGYRLAGQDGVLAGTERDLPSLLWLGLGTTAGIVAMTIPMMWEVRRSPVALRFTPRLRHWTIGRMARLSGWTFGYVAANQVALLVVIVLLDDNKRYSDAFIFFQLPHGLIAVSLMTTLTPELSSAASRQHFQDLADRFAGGLRMLLALIVPAAAGYVFLAAPITSFLARGNLTAADARLTGQTVAAFAIGLPAFSTYLLACRGFYSISDTRQPFLLNVLENGINIAGVAGLALLGTVDSTSFAAVYSVAYIVAAVVALRRFERTIAALDSEVTRPDLAAIVKIFAASVVMAAALWGVRLLLPDDAGPGAVAAVLVGMIVGAGVYLGVGLRLGIEEIGQASSMVRRRLGR